MSGPSETETAGNERPGEWYRKIVEEANDVTVVIDPDGTMTYVSPAVKRLLGYDPTDLTGDDACEYVHPEDSDTLFDAIETVRAAPEDPETVEFRCLRGDGTWCWLEATMRSRLDDEIDGIIVNGRDVTERKEREKELRTTKERMKMALEGANLGIWDWDMETDEVARDELLTEMLGYTQSEMGDHLDDWEQVVHPEGKTRHDEALAEHIEKRTPYYQCEYRLETKSGDWKWVRTMGKVVDRDETGEPTRSVGIHQDITERKMYEEALEDAREELRQVIDLIPDLIFAKNREGVYLLANETTAETFGVKPGELEGMSETEIEAAQEQFDEFREDDPAVIDSGETRVISEEKVTTADGETRIVQTTKIPFETAKTGEDAVLSYARDVTELKEREHELQAREEKYRNLFEDTRDALMLMDRDGYLDCNEQALELFGIESVDAFVEYSPWDLSPPAQPDGTDSQDAALERIDEAFEGGEAFFEWTHQRVDGTDFPAEVKLSRFEYDGDPVIHALVRDISDRKAQKRELQAREEKYRNLFEDTRDALMLLDRDGFFDCNEQALELFGIESVDAFVEYSPWKLSPATQPNGTDSKTAALDHVETAFEEGEAFFEWTHQRIDGTEFPAEVKLSRFEHQGKPALHALVRDITERKEYERQLEEQRDNLEILNQVLRHDIRNDIQLITAYTELFETECDDEKLQEYIETILENADHVVELTTSAREMADVMLSAEEELQQVGLRTVLESEIQEVESAYPEVELTEETTIPPVSVQANNMLGSVFRNLLKNAIQHNDREVPKVAVSATEREDTVVVRVADNGPGVPDNQKDAIFGKGEKGLDSQGTGIGLYLVKTLVESYGGDIRVEDRAAYTSPPDRRSETDDRTEQPTTARQANPDDEREGAVFIVELRK